MIYKSEQIPVQTCVCVCVCTFSKHLWIYNKVWIGSSRVTLRINGCPNKIHQIYVKCAFEWLNFLQSNKTYILSIINVKLRKISKKIVSVEHALNHMQYEEEEWKKKLPNESAHILHLLFTLILWMWWWWMVWLMVVV